MMPSIHLLTRRLAAECRVEYRWLRGGSVVGVLAGWGCIYAGMIGWAITLIVLAVIMAFIAITLRRDSIALDRIADLYEPGTQEDAP